jgi:hypothetical protein
MHALVKVVHLTLITISKPAKDKEKFTSVLDIFNNSSTTLKKLAF